MKVGDYCVSIFNRYYAKITKITPTKVELETVEDGVKEVIKKENFDLNWRICRVVYEYRDCIKENFGKMIYFYRLDTISVAEDEYMVTFSIVDEFLHVEVSDILEDVLGFKEANFNLDDAEEVIEMIANLIRDSQ